MRERVERLAVADLGLRDDLLQREIFLEHFGIDELERRAAYRGAGALVRFGRPARRRIDVRERGFDVQQEPRRNVGAPAPDLAQRLETCVLLLVAARALGELEELLLELVERARDRVLELVRRALEQAFEQRAHARGQVG